MTVEADLLGRPPIMHTAQVRDDEDGGFQWRPGAVPGRMSVLVPGCSSCAVSEGGGAWVSLPSPPWGRA